MITFFAVVLSIICIALLLVAFAAGIVIAIMGIKEIICSDGWGAVLSGIGLLFLALLILLISTLFIALLFT